MADFEHHPETAMSIALEIERKLVILGLDWRDHATMRRVAQAVLAPPEARSAAGFDQKSLAWQELQGLINLMLRTMEEGADSGLKIHGSDAWKALAKALWDEHEGGGSVSRET
ncbi:MAG: hypothetical protein QM776_09215 [Rhodocyclaceae bacterium]